MGAWLTASVNFNCCMQLEYKGVDRCCTAQWKLASSSGLTSCSAASSDTFLQIFLLAVQHSRKQTTKGDWKD